MDELLGALQEEQAFEGYRSSLYHILHLSDFWLPYNEQLLYHAFLTIMVCLDTDPDQYSQQTMTLSLGNPEPKQTCFLKLLFSVIVLWWLKYDNTDSFMDALNFSKQFSRVLFWLYSNPKL